MPIRPTSPRHAAALGLAVAAIITLGCSDSSVSRRLGVPPAPAAPTPNTPKSTIQLFKWCWENRDIAHYREIFTDDFVFTCLTTDSVGNPYHTESWTREDEIASATHLFVGGNASEPAASNISLVFDGNLFAQPDLRAGKTSEWHKQIQISNLTLTIIKGDGSGLRVTGGALFYLVSGDSAAIPQELTDLGLKPDAGRWFIERWEDQTNNGGVPAAVLAGDAGAIPAKALPTRKPTWCSIKSLYR